MADNYSIVVNVAGNPARRSDRAITSSQANTGEYDVTFPEDIDDWVWLATLGAADDTPQIAGSITTEGGAMGAKDVVRVRTFNQAGAATNRPYHLHVRRVRR